MNDSFSLSCSFLLPLKPFIQKSWNKVEKSIFPKTTSTSLVLWNDPNTLESTIGLPRFTKFLRSTMHLSSFHLGVIVGII